MNNGFAYVRRSITVGKAALQVQVLLVGKNAIFVLASAFNRAGVAQMA